MLTGELQALAAIPSLLDLAMLDERQRAAAWRSNANVHFPGVRVKRLGPRPAAGAIAGLRLGPGQLWTVLSPSLQVSYDPARAAPDGLERFSLMLQLEGATFARQADRASVAHPGEMCVIDGRLPFELSVAGGLSHVAILQMPRQAVLSRHPGLEHCTAECFDKEDSGSTLLRNVLVSVLAAAPAMDLEQRTTALAGVIQLLGAAKANRGRGDARGWRLRTALALIDATLADPRLSASRIAAAQDVSRRYLDDIMVAATGSSLSSRIRSRRLEQTANDMLDARFGTHSISRIARAAGFEDVAHFTRAFKRRYGIPPREWRRQHSVAAAEEPPGVGSS